MISRIDERLNRSMNRIAERLLVIDENSSGKSLKNIPEKIMTKTRTLMENFVIKSAGTERVNNQDYFVFLGVTHSMMYEIWMDQNGDLYKINGRELLPEAEFLENEFIDEAHFYGTDHVYFLFMDTKGSLIANSDMDAWKDLEDNPFPRDETGLKTQSISHENQHLKIRVLNMRLSDRRVLQGGIKLSEEYDLLSKISILFFSLLFIIMLSGVIFSWIISGKAMAGIKRVVKISNTIDKENLSYRVAVGNEGEEIGELVESFNSMLSRIEKLVFELKEISDNIAHDLRTPLTRIRGIIETTVNSKADTSGYFSAFGEILEECDRLVNIINTMLEITQNETAIGKLDRKKISLNSIINEAYKLFLPVAELKNINFTIQLQENDVNIHGDLTKIQRMIANIIDNAIKFTPNKGDVGISLIKKNDQALIIITDTGIGISKDDEKHIFERFYRCENSRFLTGNGLGLSLASSIAKIHDGEIRFTSKMNKGSSFTIILPLY